MSSSQPTQQFSMEGKALRAWARRNLFSSWFNTVLTVLLLYVFWVAMVPLIDWLVIDAQWSGRSPDACLNKSAACWPFVWDRFDQFIYGQYPLAERWRVNLGIALGIVLASPLLFPRLPHRKWLITILLTIYPLLAIYLFVGGGGLPVVETQKWGGFFLTIVVSVFVMTTSLPMGILLALGRRSKIPLIKVFCAGWIEIWRSIPVVVVLFVAIILFPLFMPAELEIDKLLRAVVALAILMSCFLAEAIRGALQSIPGGQFEASAALGLGYWDTMRLIMIPQALKTALPQILSNFIGLFKETTVLLIIGFHDLLGMVQSASSDPQWAGQNVRTTGYFFVAFFFWACCFAMSRYGAFLERRLSRGFQWK